MNKNGVISIVLAILVAGCSSTSTETKDEVASINVTPLSAQDSCMVGLLGMSCYAGNDPKAPFFMTYKGKAACFVGLDYSQKFSYRQENLDKPFVNMISAKSLERSDFLTDIDDINKCIQKTGHVLDCDIAFIKAFSNGKGDVCERAENIKKASTSR